MAGGRKFSDGLLPGSSQLELAICLTLHWCCCGDQPALSQRFDGRHQPGGRHVESLRQSRPSNRGLLLETEQEPGRERIELNASAGCEPTVELVEAVTAGQHVKCAWWAWRRCGPCRSPGWWCAVAPRVAARTAGKPEPPWAPSPGKPSKAIGRRHAPPQHAGLLVDVGSRPHSPRGSD